MRIGLIGFGFMGGVHLAAMEQIEDATVAAIAARTRPTPGSPSRGNLPQVKSAALPAEAKWYYDWRGLIQDPDIDAVDICLPTSLHKEVTLKAFQAGKHVLCEKPMALTPSDCDQMLEAADKSGRTLMVGQVLRFMFPYQYAASFVSTTCGSAITSCTLRRKTGYPQWSEWLANETSSGGAILDLLSHDIDQALNIFGHPASVSAVSDGEIDTMLGKLHYSNGLEVKIEGGWYEPELPFSASFTITGQDAELTFEEGRLRLHRAGVEQLVEQPEPLEYRDEIAYFMECCRNHVVPALCPPAESAQAVKLAALLKASRDQNGKEVSCVL